MLAASVLTMAVVFDRSIYLNRNQRDLEQLTQRLRRDLEQGNYSQAQYTANITGGVIGAVAEEGVRLLSNRTREFSTAFDISVNLGLRKLEKNLSILGTIGAVTPFLGLLGTVVGILRSFNTFAKAGAGSSELAKEIGFALIATAAGLIIAILAVVAYNIFNSFVTRFEDDFQQLKLLFLNFEHAPVVREGSVPAPALESKPFPQNLL